MTDDTMSPSRNEVSGTIHMTAMTFDGRETFTTGVWRGPLGHIEKAVRKMHATGGMAWTTSKAVVVVDPADVNSETIALLSFVPDGSP